MRTEHRRECNQRRKTATLSRCPGDERDAARALTEGFIHHPTTFPVTIRTIRQPWWRRRPPSVLPPSQIGILFRSVTYVPAGTLIEFAVTLRAQIHCFQGEIVFVREYPDGYETGFWLQSHEDAHRAQIVEQICHMEHFLKMKRLREGPYLSRESVSQAWTDECARNFAA